MPYDSKVMQKMTLLADCLCTVIAQDSLPDVCFCGIVPGDQVTIDYVNCKSNDKCGMAYVRLVEASPTTGIGVVDDSMNQCSATIGFVVEVGILRCAPAPNLQGGPPAADALLAATDLQIADMTSMRRAIVCCEGIGDFILDIYTPFGPDGGSVGGFWQVTLSED